MTLNYIDINGYGVLVDESAEIKEGCLVELLGKVYKVRKIELQYAYLNGINSTGASPLLSSCKKIICAESELNLDVPILNWRQWEFEQLVQNQFKDYWKKEDGTNLKGEEISAEMMAGYLCEVSSFIAGYNHNKKLYTEEDLREAFKAGQLDKGNNWYGSDLNQYIQLAQKLPSYIVIEDYDAKVNKLGRIVNPFDLTQNQSECDWVISPKLTTNSQGKQEVIIKEIIY